MNVKDEINKPAIEQNVPKKDKSKVYFFMIAIVALLFTNVYFYIKFKYSGEKLYTISLQKENLQIEIDRIEAELDNMRPQEIELNSLTLNKESQARELIFDLRKKLEESGFDDDEYVSAKAEIVKLKSSVNEMKEEVNSLKIKNALLAKENISMEDPSPSDFNNQSSPESLMTVAADENPNLTRVSSLKVSNMHINGVHYKKDNDVDIDMRARRVDKLQINFTIADNTLANIGKKEIFVRIINPKGNLIAESENLFFVHGEKLQYTFKEHINFTNNGEEYQFLWGEESGKGFLKGAYTILLYSNNTIMGRSSVVLK